MCPLILWKSSNFYLLVLSRIWNRCWLISVQTNNLWWMHWPVLWLWWSNDSSPFFYGCERIPVCSFGEGCYDLSNMIWHTCSKWWWPPSLLHSLSHTNTHTHSFIFISFLPVNELTFINMVTPETILTVLVECLTFIRFTLRQTCFCSYANRPDHR